MWHALRAELVYFRGWLAGALGIAVGVVALISGIFHAVGEEGPEPHAAAGLRGMFLMMAPLILGFIVQVMRGEERRLRLLMAAPLTPRQLAGATVLVPVVLFAVGIVGAALTLTIEYLVTGSLAFESFQLIAYVGGMIFMMTLVALLIQETVAAHQQRRRMAATGAWALFAAMVVVYAVSTGGVVVVQGPNSWPILHLGNVVIALAAVIGTVVLFSGRTDFTS